MRRLIQNNTRAVAVGILALLALLCVLAASSCSPPKRLARLIKKHPGLVKIDTLRYQDTLIVRERRVDTIFYYNQHDTVIKEMNGVTLKYYFNSKDSTVFLEGKTKHDTIIREIRIPYQTVQPVLSPLTFAQKIKIFIFDWLPLVALLIVLFFWAKSRFSK